MGLVLVTRQHKVFVTGAKEGTIAGHYFKVTDRVLLVSGTPVSDREVARALILSSKGKFQAVVERAVTDAAIMEVKQLEEAYRAEVARQVAQAKADDMPRDVQDIVAKQRDKLKQKPEEKKKILQRSPSSESLKKVSVTQGHEEVDIASDVDPQKKLRTVPRG
ncbi:MAG: hypothetical protein GY696_39795 [Gammaproteobacteria bacterium]|nr:hypothetical protein [Gammaproteobacteria bacterium]